MSATLMEKEDKNAVELPKIDPDTKESSEEQTKGDHKVDVGEEGETPGRGELIKRKVRKVPVFGTFLVGKEEGDEHHDFVPHKFPTPRGILDFFKGLYLIWWENRFLYLLLLAIPFAIASDQAKWGDIPTFILCLVAIMPLAKVLGSATEEVSLYFNQTIGGLLNATFGNAVEMIISIVALKNGLLRIVQASLLGSILSNVLLVLGSAFVIGGTKYKEQRFNAVASSTQGSLLLISVASILMPAAFFLTNSTANIGDELTFSRISAIVVLIVYICYLIFQLKTHGDLFEDEAVEGEEEEKPKLAMWGAIFLLAGATVIIAVLSEFLMDSIEKVTLSLHINETFIGIVILPIVGNAAEHVSALTFAAKNKMNLSIGIAVGSSIQIALLVIPVLVLLGWCIGQPLDLYFLGYETAALFITVIIVNSVIQDGKSNWLEGVLLLVAYFVIAVGFFFHK